MGGVWYSIYWYQQYPCPSKLVPLSQSWKPRNRISQIPLPAEFLFRCSQWKSLIWDVHGERISHYFPLEAVGKLCKDWVRFAVASRWVPVICHFLKSSLEALCKLLKAAKDLCDFHTLSPSNSFIGTLFLSLNPFLLKYWWFSDQTLTDFRRSPS